MAGTKIYFQCDDVKIQAQRCTKNGGKIVMPKMSLGEFGNISLINDTEGNLIGLNSMI